MAHQQIVSRLKSLCSIATLTLVVGFASPASADILTVRSFSDIEIVDEDPQTSFDLFARLDPLIPATNTLLHMSPAIDVDQDNRQALIEVDLYDGLGDPLLPSGTVINSAVFRINVVEAERPDDIVFGIEAFAGLEEGLGGFNPEYLTLANPLLENPDSEPGGLGYHEFDETGFVQGLVDAGSRNATFQLAANQDVGILVTRPPADNPEVIPTLTIDFTLVPEPSTFVLTTLALLGMGLMVGNGTKKRV